MTTQYIDSSSLAYELHKLLSCGSVPSVTAISTLIENHRAVVHDSRSQRLTIVGGCGFPVDHKVADEIVRLRAQIKTLQNELSDRIRDGNMAAESRKH